MRKGLEDGKFSYYELKKTKEHSEEMKQGLKVPGNSSRKVGK